VLKLFSTPDDPSVAIAEAVERIAGGPRAKARVLGQTDAALKRRSPTKPKSRFFADARDNRGTNALLQREEGVWHL